MDKDCLIVIPARYGSQRFPGKVLQGNLDPCALLAGRDVACRKARTIVEAMAGHPHVFNLGHGLLPETDPEVVGAVIEAVKGS